MVAKVMAQSPDMLLVVDGQGQVLQVNPVASLRLGYQANEMAGRSFHQFIPFSFPLPENLLLLSQEVSLPCYALHRDGSRVAVSWSAFWSQEEQLYYLVGRPGSREPDDRPAADSAQGRERLELIDRLEQKNHHLEQFAYIVSHHLRAPVANILGLTQLFSPEENDQDLHAQVIENLRKSAQALDATIQGLNQILSSRDALKQSRERVDLAALLASIQNTLKEDIIRSEAVLEADFSLVPVLTTVKSFLHNLLLGLIRDALRFRDPATPLQIKIVSSWQENKICLTIHNNSLNLKLLKNHALEDLTCCDGPGNHPVWPGQLLRTQVEALGGKVAWEAAPGKGCTFKLFLTN
ncbi:MAG: histidine kinase dimerization/phospho-acceptor domain-containing protein [Adhaeribacter sp.]